jgi:hypothetical protein
MKRSVSSLLVLLLSSCTQYFYYARKPDADGQGHEALAQWSVTERTLWFDESSETVSVNLQCGRTLPFQERAGGLYVLYDPATMAEPKLVDGIQSCGKVVGVERLDEIGVGDSLQLELWCKPIEDDEGFTLALELLQPGRYEFQRIQRSEQRPRAKPCPASPQAAR